MASIDLPNNLVDVVGKITTDFLKYYQMYSGEVMDNNMSGENQGIIEVYSIAFSGVRKFDSSKWLSCKPAVISNNSIIPEVGDYVYFTFKDGSPDTPIYFGQAYDYYEFVESGNKKVVFEYSGLLSDASLYYDKDDGKFIIKAGNDALEKSVLGETLKSFLEAFLDVFINNSASFTTPTVPGNPAGLSATVINDLTQLKLVDLDDILSDNLENN